MLRTYIIYYKYKNPGDKKPGPVKHYRVSANNLEEARQLASQYGNYPDLEVVRVTPI